MTGNPRAQQVANIKSGALAQFDLDPDIPTALILGAGVLRAINAAAVAVIPELNKRDYQTLPVTGQVLTMKRFEISLSATALARMLKSNHTSKRRQQFYQKSRLFLVEQVQLVLRKLRF